VTAPGLYDDGSGVPLSHGAEAVFVEEVPEENVAPRRIPIHLPSSVRDLHTVNAHAYTVDGGCVEGSEHDAGDVLTPQQLMVAELKAQLRRRRRAAREIA
jgi:hypothetical protein